MSHAERTRAIGPSALAGYRDDGFLVVADLFGAREVAAVSRIVPVAARTASAKVIRETGGQVRSVFCEPGDFPVVDVAVRQRRLLQVAEALLGGRVYVYQVKLNTKTGLSGELWPWHQDYVFWREKDALPRPDILTVGVLLDEATEFNGPMYFIPGSHRQGVIDPRVRAAAADGDYAGDLAADLSFTVPGDAVSALVGRHGMVSAKGAAGTAIFFDGNVVHASANNLSPFDRTILFVTYCRVDNVSTQQPPRRPSFLVNRDSSPVDALGEAAFAPFA